MIRFHDHLDDDRPFWGWHRHGSENDQPGLAHHHSVSPGDPISIYVPSSEFMWYVYPDDRQTVAVGPDVHLEHHLHDNDGAVFSGLHQHGGPPHYHPFVPTEPIQYELPDWTHPLFKFPREALEALMYPMPEEKPTESHGDAPPGTPAPDMHRLAAWWREDMQSGMDATLAKLHEYGSGDLAAIGHDLADTFGSGEIPDREAMEWGCWFYLIGKIARIRTAYERGMRPSDDSLFDAEVYIRMMRANRAEVWPIPGEVEQ